MESVPKVAVEAYTQRMREATEAMLRGVMGTVVRQRCGVGMRVRESTTRFHLVLWFFLRRRAPW